MDTRVQKYRPDYDIRSGQRIIRNDGAQYDHYFPKAEGKDTIIIKDGEVQDTIRLIERVVWTYIKDTAQIASLFKRATTEETLNAIWTFLYYNIQYKLDEQGLEQLRRPARAWKDRISGIDCDCFSIFCSSILCNLGIAHKFRITKYSQAHWQHIYVIVPKTNQVDYWTIDAVLSAFNYEKPFTQKMDYAMSLNGINIAVLSGFGGNAADNLSADYIQIGGGIVMNAAQINAANNRALNAAISGIDLFGLGLIDEEAHLLGATEDRAIENALYRYLLATRQGIVENPQTASIAGYQPEDIIKMLDYAIQYWYTDKREQALGQLMLNEDYLNQMNGFGALGQLLGEDELFGDDDIFFGIEGGLGKAKKNVGKNPKQKAKPKAFFKKVGNGIKKVGKGIVRFNPVTIAARNGFLLALKTNVGKISEKLKWAYATPQQAQAKGVHPDTIKRAKSALAKIEKLFSKIGGKPENLRKAVLSSKRGRLNGLGSLGVAPAAAIAAATPIIVATINIMKQSGLVGKNEQVDITSTGSEDESVSFDTSNMDTANESNNEVLEISEPIESEEPIEGLGAIGTGIIQFAQNNPLLGLAIGGAVAYGVYHLVQSEQPKTATQSSPALSGTKKKKFNKFQLT